MCTHAYRPWLHAGIHVHECFVQKKNHLCPLQLMEGFAMHNIWVGLNTVPQNSEHSMSCTWCGYNCTKQHSRPCSIVSPDRLTVTPNYMQCSIQGHTNATDKDWFVALCRINTIVYNCNQHCLQLIQRWLGLYEWSLCLLMLMHAESCSCNKQSSPITSWYFVCYTGQWLLFMVSCRIVFTYTARKLIAYIPSFFYLSCHK